MTSVRRKQGRTESPRTTDVAGPVTDAQVEEFVRVVLEANKRTLHDDERRTQKDRREELARSAKRILSGEKRGGR